MAPPRTSRTNIGPITLWPVNKKFQWTGQGLKFLKKFRFGLEWPPAASGPQKSTMNRIFGRFFPSFIKFHCNRTIFEVFFGSGGRGALWSLNKKWGFYICVSYHQISYSLARVYPTLSRIGSKLAPHRPQTGPNSAPTWFQIGPKSAPNWPHIGPKFALNRAHIGSISAQNSATWADRGTY